MDEPEGTEYELSNVIVERKLIEFILNYNVEEDTSNFILPLFSTLQSIENQVIRDTTNLTLKLFSGEDHSENCSNKK
jgi:hypothetical protein